jgi:hypothetical protein
VSCGGLSLGALGAHNPLPMALLLAPHPLSPVTWRAGAGKSLGPLVTVADSPTPPLCSYQTGWAPQPADTHGTPSLPAGCWLPHQH